MPVRSRALIIYGSTLSGGSVVSLYTCPVDRTAIVREFALINRSGVAADAAMGIRRGGVTAWTATNGALPAGATLGGRLSYFVLHPGDELVVYLLPAGGAAAGAAVYASGALLTGVPT